MKTPPNKRLVFTISLTDVGKNFDCGSGCDLITTHNSLGLNNISNRCKRGGCGLCRVQIIKGTYTTKTMNRSYISLADLQHNIVLACCVIPTSDLLIKRLPAKASFSITPQKKA